MNDPPGRSEPEDDGGADAERGAGTGKRRWPSRLVGILVIAMAVVLVGLMVFLHLNGTLGPGTH
jgi:hypothetical protein